MNKKDTIEFFDHCAPTWDSQLIRSDEVINIILDNAGVGENSDVLDVACGTGVLFPDYIKRGAAHITGIDISPKMVEIVEQKFSYENVDIICGDAETEVFNNKFDVIMVYNAFPHFPDPENLIRTLSEKLKPNGRLSIAHGMSRQAIDSHHSHHANSVSVGLMDEKELAELFCRYLKLETVISDEHMYQVVGINS